MAIYRLLIAGVISSSTVSVAYAETKPPLAVSLSYDDALQSQLDNVVPALNARGIHASFYLVPSYPGFSSQPEAWAAVAKAGHELGNHSYTHPCRASKPNREWVAENNDLDKISADDMVGQIEKTNEILSKLDGQPSRTYTPPCGDKLAAGENYLDKLGDRVDAIKGYDLSGDQEVVYAPEGATAEDLINIVSQQPESVKVVSLIFHGVGGDYIKVDAAEHAKFLDYLVAHPNAYYVDSYRAVRAKLDAGRK